MKTFADVKRRLVVGTSLVMVRHDWASQHFSVNQLLNVPRKIVVRQSNGIQFEPIGEGKRGSWLYFPAASTIRVRDSGFDVCLGEGDFVKLMRYEFVESDSVGTTDSVASSAA